MNKRIIISTHIEKTAGTSLLKFFETALGKNRIAFYDPTTDSIIRTSDLLLSPSNEIIDKFQLKSYAFWPYIKKFYFHTRAKKRNSITIEKDLFVIHGHFTADRFDKYTENPLRVILLRDPLERMFSQYHHWKRSKGRNQWRVTIPYDPKLTFEEYSLLAKLRNYQTQALAGKDLAHFDLVGVTENMEQYSAALFDMLISNGYSQPKQKNISFSKLNQNSQKKAYAALSKSFQEKFRNYHKDDYVLYQQALTYANTPTAPNAS